MRNQKLVIGLAGMPGSGKSLVVTAAREEGYGVVVMGDVIREETRRRGLKATPKNIGKVMIDLRKIHGANVIAEKCLSIIVAQEKEKVLIDGLRSLDEVNTLKAHFPKFSLLAVHSSPEKRFKRLFRRGRSDDPDSWDLFDERDMRELGVGLGNVVARSEYLILNDGSMFSTKAKTKAILRRIEKRWKQ